MRFVRGLLAISMITLVGACASPGKNVTTAPSFDTVVSGTPAPTATATAKPAVPAGYGKTCRAYSEGVLAAWKNRDLVRLSDLTIPAVLDKLLGVPGPPKMNWKFGRVVSETGVDTCHFYNSDGDVIRLGISKDVLGKPHAAFKVEVEQPVYHNDFYLYVMSLLNATMDGNEPLMLLYSTPEVVTGLKDSTVPPGRLDVRIGVPEGPIRVLEVKQIGSSFLIEFEVQIALIGKPHAVTRLIY